LITQSVAGNLTRLTITGTSGNDSIVVTQSGTTLTIIANGTTSTVTGAIGELAIYGGDGNDTITVQSNVTIPSLVYGGAGTNTLTDLASVKSFIVTIGAGINTLTGDALTSFWANPGDAITGGMATNVHRVAGFYQPFSTDPGNPNYIPLTLNGQNLPDPTDAGGTTRLTNSLWGAGPTMTDINQGGIADCYYLASLQSLALEQPALLQDMAVDLGDGTYAVQFQRGGTTTYVRVDGDLSLGYAHPSAGGPIWASIFEKAYAYFRTGASTYSSLNVGWTGSVFSDLGVATGSFYADNASIFNMLTTALANHKAVAVLSNPSVSGGIPIIGNHAYTVAAAFVDAGTQYITVRNPWGFDGAGLDANPSDGLVTLTLAQFQTAFFGGSIQS
jgi:hypothetical protein